MPTEARIILSWSVTSWAFQHICLEIDWLVQDVVGVDEELPQSQVFCEDP